MKQFQDTNFYSYWKNRLKKEKEYIVNKEDKTIGDIVNIYKREENIKMKIDVVGDRHRFLQHGEHIDLEVKNDHYTSKVNDDIAFYTGYTGYNTNEDNKDNEDEFNYID